ncbi:MAG: sulfotransferase domain-containing protein [Oligoflexia bacterium]|nr:sulfotransferase domain-containing protein [Oligoflexia bacterium]
MAFEPLAGQVVVFGTHHKSGTALLRNICEAVAQRLGLPFELCRIEQILAGEAYARLERPCLALDTHSRLDFSKLKLPSKALHVVRDPREIVVSGYFYHLKCSEEWCTTPHPNYEGRSYQDLLKSKSQEQGLDLELEIVAAKTLRDMLEWRVPKETQALELQFENFLQDYEDACARMFTFALSCTPDLLQRCIKIASHFDLKRKSRAQLEQNSHVTNYELNPRRWEKVLSARQLEVIKQRYGDFMRSRGYL